MALSQVPQVTAVPFLTRDGKSSHALLILSDITCFHDIGNVRFEQYIVRHKYSNVRAFGKDPSNIGHGNNNFPADRCFRNTTKTLNNANNSQIASYTMLYNWIMRIIWNSMHAYEKILNIKKCKTICKNIFSILHIFRILTYNVISVYCIIKCIGCNDIKTSRYDNTWV